MDDRIEEMIEVGEFYETYGGWAATVIWKNRQTNEDEAVSYIVVHKPGTDGEAIALCDENGIANSMFGLNEPPTYDAHHPADLRLDS